MKPTFLFLTLSMFTFMGFSQEEYPVKWKQSSEAIDELTYSVQFEAQIDEPYHIYPQGANSGGMGMPTRFLFDENPNLIIIGSTEEKGVEESKSKPKSYYKKKVKFTQVVKLKEHTETTFKATVRFMACTKQMCLLPASKEFKIILGQ